MDTIHCKMCIFYIQLVGVNKTEAYNLYHCFYPEGNTTDNATATDATATDYNGMAIAIILGGLMGFLLLILATVTLGTCVVCICLCVCKSRRKRKKTSEILTHELQVYKINYIST